MFSILVCHQQNSHYWTIAEGQYGPMLVGEDGDIMIEASTWKNIQEKLNGECRHPYFECC